MSPSWAAVVLAGGSARRLGGRDKPALVVGGRTLLDRAVGACAGADELVVVGPARPTEVVVRWTREEPAGSGPLAALAAGLDVVRGDPPVVVVLAADLPAITPRLVHRLVGTLPADAEALLVTDAEGRPQPLLGAYRRVPLTAALREAGDPRGRPFHTVLGSLSVATVPAAGGASDIDTTDDLARWQTRLAETDAVPTDMERDD